MQVGKIDALQRHSSFFLWLLGIAFGLYVVFVASKHWRFKRFVNHVRTNDGEVFYKPPVNEQEKRGQGYYNGEPHISVFGSPLYVEIEPVMVDYSGVNANTIDWSLFSLTRPKIERLVLAKTSFTDGHIPLLYKLPELEYLDLSETQVSGKFFEEMLSHINLIELVLINTQVTYSNLECLTREPQLKRLDVSSPFLDDHAIAKLRDKIPWCNIVDHRKLQESR